MLGFRCRAPIAWRVVSGHSTMTLVHDPNCAPLLNRPKQAQSWMYPDDVFFGSRSTHMKPAAYVSQTLTFFDTSHTHLQRKAHRE